MPPPARRRVAVRLGSRIAVCTAACAGAAVLAACTSGGDTGASAGSSDAATPASTSAAPVTSTPAPVVTTTVTSTAATSTAAPAPRTTSRAAPTPPVTVARGTVVVLNPGHNGGNASHTAEINRQVPAGYGMRKACDTTGTSTNAGYPEHAFTWDVAVRVRRALEAAGITVRMTRDSDDGVGPCVDERAAIGNRSDVAASVSIHADGAPSSGHGFHVNQASRRPDGATAAVARESRELGRDIHQTLEADSGLTPSTYIGSDGYFYRSDLAGLNLATRPTTFLELGNMRNAGDAALLSSAKGRARIASAITAGIIAYLR